MIELSEKTISRVCRIPDVVPDYMITRPTDRSYHIVRQTQVEDNER